jgi:hypothetical protein
MPIYYREMDSTAHDGLVEATAERQQLLCDHAAAMLNTDHTASLIQFMKRTATIKLGEAIPSVIYMRLRVNTRLVDGVS